MKAETSKQLHLQALRQKASTWRSLPADLRHVALFFWNSLLRRKRMFPALLLAASLFALFLVRPFESGFNSWLQARFDSPFFNDAASWLSWSGEYFFPLMVVLPCWLLGCFRRSRRLQVLAACILVSFVASSLVVRAGKIATGRLRPIVAERNEQPDTFIGPTLKPKYHGFPSGHTAAAFATSTPVLFVHPALGGALSLCSGLIALSRTHENQHYPSDLVAGIAVGILCSLPARRLLQAFPSSNAPDPHIATHEEPSPKRQRPASE